MLREAFWGFSFLFRGGRYKGGIRALKVGLWGFIVSPKPEPFIPKRQAIGPENIPTSVLGLLNKNLFIGV